MAVGRGPVSFIGEFQSVRKAFALPLPAPCTARKHSQPVISDGVKRTCTCWCVSALVPALPEARSLCAGDTVTETPAKSAEHFAGSEARRSGRLLEQAVCAPHPQGCLDSAADPEKFSPVPGRCPAAAVRDHSGRAEENSSEYCGRYSINLRHRGTKPSPARLQHAARPFETGSPIRPDPASPGTNTAPGTESIDGTTRYRNAVAASWCDAKVETRPARSFGWHSSEGSGKESLSLGSSAIQLLTSEMSDVSGWVVDGTSRFVRDAPSLGPPSKRSPVRMGVSFCARGCRAGCCLRYRVRNAAAAAQVRGQLRYRAGSGD